MAVIAYVSRSGLIRYDLRATAGTRIKDGGPLSALLPGVLLSSRFIERKAGLVSRFFGAQPFQFIPVSYTHLDVYKRQVWRTGAVRISSTACGITVPESSARRSTMANSSSSGRTPSMASRTLPENLYGLAAVSYTHLDVYKRQDVSRWQGNIDWNAVAADDVEFVMLGTRSKGAVDPYFHKNVKEASDAGVRVGAYIYSLATTCLLYTSRCV